MSKDINQLRVDAARDIDQLVREWSDHHGCAARLMGFEPMEVGDAKGMTIHMRVTWTNRALDAKDAFDEEVDREVARLRSKDKPQRKTTRARKS